MDVQGFYRVPGGQSYVSPAAAEKTVTLKDSAGLLHYLRVCNTTGAKIYVFVFDAATAAGTVLVTPPIPIAANDFVEIQTFALPFSTGCTVSISTTQKVYTAGGNNDIQVHAIFK